MKIWAGMVALGLALGAMGCGEVPDPGVEEKEGAWSEANCTIATADASYTGGVVPQYRSPTTYSNARCGKAVVVDLTNYSSTYSGPASGGAPADMDGQTKVEWIDAAPTTQTACAELWMGVILYRRLNGAWVEQAHREQFGGVWARNPFTGVFQCTTPAIPFHTTFASDLVVGRSYRFAATARTQSSSSAPTRALGITSLRPTVIQ